MSETNKDVACAFYKAVTEGRVEDAFRLYAVPTSYRQHNPLIEDGMEGLRKVVTWLTDARCEIKRVFADRDYASQCSRTLPPSRRKMSTTASPRGLSDKPCQ